MQALENKDRGFALVPFLVVMALGAALLVGALKLSASTVRAIGADKIRSQRYFTSESTLNLVTSWLRENSQSMVKPFSKEDFYNIFERSAPSYGANDVGPSKIPTKVKIKGTNNSVVLANNNEIATSAFPSTQHIVTGAAFDTVSQFQGAGLGEAQVRLTLVDALPLDPAKDAPPLAAPETDFFPVYRVDAVTESDRGAHVFGYITGNLFYVDTVGIYGHDFVQMANPCTSAVFVAANPGALNAKCPVGSNGPITIANNSKIFGSARSNQSVAPTEKVCGDYPNCSTPGNTCAGASCNVPGLPTFGPWDSYCDAGSYKPNPALPANRDTELQNPGCYDTIAIANKAQVTLSATIPLPSSGIDPKPLRYYINNLSVDGGNRATQLKALPAVENGVVELYVNNIVGNRINGNQTINMNARPAQFKIYYLGNQDIKINGTSQVGFAFIAPYANVELLGTTEFHGGIIAKSVTVSGSATLIYDESLGGQILNDLSFRLRSMEEGYN